MKKYFSGKRSVLEIGSSTGAFMQLLGKERCYGVEPADENRRFSSRFARKVYPKLSDVPKNKKFDIICMFHVLEHVFRPVAFLNRCKNNLARNGMIVIEVPCIDDPLVGLYSSRPFRDFYFQPIHPYVYSEKSLDYVFSRSGYSKKDVIFYQRYGLANHLAWLSRGKPHGDSYLESVFGGNKHYRKNLESAKKTDTLFYIAGRKDKDAV